MVWKGYCRNLEKSIRLIFRSPLASPNQERQPSMRDLRCKQPSHSPHFYPTLNGNYGAVKHAKTGVRWWFNMLWKCRSVHIHYDESFSIVLETACLFYWLAAKLILSEMYLVRDGQVKLWGNLFLQPTTEKKSTFINFFFSLLEPLYHSLKTSIHSWAFVCIFLNYSVPQQPSFMHLPGPWMCEKSGC